MVPEGNGQVPEGDATPSQDEAFDAEVNRELEPELNVVRVLGRGSMGVVYLAREQALRRLVAVKVLASTAARDARARKRFEREAHAAARLSHPNIVSVYGVGRTPESGLPYIVMQYVEGPTMAQRLRSVQRLQPEEAGRILAAVASALKHAHEKGVVHRDVRPGNVLYEDSTGQPLLTDFGIAAILESATDETITRLTLAGERVGDPAYMSPEQIEGEPVTGRSDIYALGLLGYDLLAGTGPFDARPGRELFAAQLRDEPRPLRSLRSDAPRELESLLLRCLAKEPEHRPSAADVHGELTGGSASRSRVNATVAAGTPVGWIARLTERRIPQIALIYGAGGWVVLQAVDLLVDNRILPEVSVPLFLVSFLLGVPAVLLGAWYHGRRGRQRFRPVEYWLFGGLALIWLALCAFILATWLGGG